jgi:hypothetical protein
MAKNKISEFDVNPDNNTDINNINIAEGCAPSGINNAIRQLMSDLKEFQTGGGGDSMTAVGLFSDTVGEKTSGAGVTVDGVLIKDNAVTASGGFSGAVNGTVGATTANTGAFTTLSASGVTTVSAGTVSAPAITTSGDTNTGIFFPAADTIAFTEGGAEAMRIDSSGNVGIGTSSPSAKLDVVGNVRTTTYYNFNGNGSNPTTVDAAIYDQSFVGPTISGSSITFRTSSTTPAERMRIDSSGNVGIGTTAAGQKLNVDGSLQLYGANNTRGIYWNMYGVNSDYIDVNGAADGNIMRFGTTNTERMRIDGSGKLFFACTGQTGDAPNASGRITETNGNEKVRVSADTQVAFQFYSPSGGTGSPVGTITVNASSVSYNTSSDYRLKENIAPMTGALAKVSTLKPVTYTWKSTGEASQGFIAHELAEVVPDCVTGEKDGVETYIDEDGVEQTRPKYQGIDTSFLVATLTAAIQELKAIVDAQATRIEALENK